MFFCNLYNQLYSTSQNHYEDEPTQLDSFGCKVHNLMFIFWMHHLPKNPNFPINQIILIYCYRTIF